MSAGADLEELAWPLSRAHELLDALGTESRLRPTRAARPPGASALRDTATFAAWLQASARWAGLEIEPTVLPMADLPTLVRGAAPLVLGWGDGLLALAGTTPRGRVRLVGPDGRVATVAAARVLRALRRHAEAGVAPQVDAMLERAGLTGRRRAHARDRLLDRRLAAQQLGPVWLLRPSAHADYLTRARRWGLGRLLLGLLGLTVASQLLLLGAWTLVGRGALSGRLDGGWMLGWALLLLSAVPVDTTRDWIASLLGVRLGAQLKQRLLVGALRMAPEQIRHEGVGGLLGRVIESQAVELLALNGGLTVVLAVVQLAIAGAALGLGASGPWLVLCMALWCAGLVGAAARLYAGRRRWTRLRHELTGELVEAMVGHRTRLAQESPERFHEREAHALGRYARASERLDRFEVWVASLGGRGFLVVGLLALGPAVVAGVDSGALAVSIGLVFLVAGTMGRLLGGLSAAAGAGVAWEQVRDLFLAAGAAPRPASPALATLSQGPSVRGRPLLEARQVGFSYAGRGRPVLQDLDLTLHHGDRVLLLGASGGGKSTLASLLVGLREPSQGLLLLDGLDRRTLGDDGWRSRAVAAPQFHDNRIFVGTLAYNLLMGRAWPARPGDLADAETLCVALGLGPLLDRMPGRLQQMVGASGWQLSHGERSRVYLARALLQDAPLVVLDESFAALDPENLARCLEQTAQRAGTLVVIAHP